MPLKSVNDTLEAVNSGVLKSEDVYVEVYYNSKSPLGGGWSSGSTRMTLDAVGVWLLEQKREVLVTHLTVL